MILFAEWLYCLVVGYATSFIEWLPTDESHPNLVSIKKSTSV